MVIDKAKMALPNTYFAANDDMVLVNLVSNSVLDDLIRLKLISN